MLTYAQKQKQQSEKHQFPNRYDTDVSMLQSLGNQAVIQMMSQGDTESDPDLLEKIRNRSANRVGNAISSPTASSEQNKNTGIPAHTKQKFEDKSGFSYDDVKVHYNSDKPAELGALAYTQGNQVYIAPGQEEHLEHELGHVAQQKAGVVRATGSVDGLPINDYSSLEQTANLSNYNFNYLGQTKQTENVIQLKPTPPNSLPPLPTGLARHHIIPESILNEFWDKSKNNKKFHNDLKEFIFNKHKKRFSQNYSIIKNEIKTLNSLKHKGATYNEKDSLQPAINEESKFRLNKYKPGNAVEEDEFYKALFVWMPSNLVIGKEGKNRKNDPGNGFDYEALKIAGKNEKQATGLFEMINQYIQNGKVDNLQELFRCYKEYMASPNVFIDTKNSFA